jgi:hypothetical protein
MEIGKNAYVRAWWGIVMNPEIALEFIEPHYAQASLNSD